MRVPTPWPRPMLALMALVKFMKKVAVLIAGSGMMNTLTVLLRSPGLKTRVPLADAAGERVVVHLAGGRDGAADGAAQHVGGGVRRRRRELDRVGHRGRVARVALDAQGIGAGGRQRYVEVAARQVGKPAGDR